MTNSATTSADAAAASVKAYVAIVGVDGNVEGISIYVLLLWVRQ